MIRPVKNPPKRFESYFVEWIDAPDARQEVFEEEAKSIITENKSPDVAFRFSVNPYRGCFHACAYCYARPSHQYLDFGAGTDFERKIVIKVNAPLLLEREFQKPSWLGDELVFSGITDCYQPLEASYGITRKCLEVCARYRNPVGIITKSAIIRRDIDVLLRLSERASVRVFFSIPFADDELARKLEPGAPRSSTRFRAMKALSSAGIDVGVAVAPVIPGLSDEGMVTVLERARDSGASFAFMTLLRLPAEVREVFQDRLQEQIPERAAKVMGALKEMRNGKLNESEFGKRMSGEGERWRALEWLFAQSCKRLGLNAFDEKGAHSEKRKSTFERMQLSLPGF